MIESNGIEKSSSSEGGKTKQNKKTKNPSGTSRGRTPGMCVVTPFEPQPSMPDLVRSAFEKTREVFPSNPDIFSCLTEKDAKIAIRCMSYVLQQDTDIRRTGNRSFHAERKELNVGDHAYVTAAAS